MKNNFMIDTKNYVSISKTHEKRFGKKEDIYAKK